MNKLVTGKCWNLPTAGSALTVGDTYLRGCGRRRAVWQNALPSSIWGWWALEGTLFLAGFHPPLQTCPVLRHHYPGQEERDERQKQDEMSGALGVSISAAAGCLFLQHPTLAAGKSHPPNSKQVT